MKTEITKEEYLQLVGLLTLARQHKKMVDEIEEAMKQVIGEEADYGHCGDAIWENDGTYTANDLLKKLKIKVNASKKLHNKSTRKS
jgi:hypothetical protein